jgi:hypothetical protein
MKCRACGFDHASLERCEVAARKRVVHAPMVVHAEGPRVVHGPRGGEKGTRHGKYADPEARRKYRREWMVRARREGRA